MADVQEDVTLMAHIRAEDDASDQVAQVESGFTGLRSTVEDMAAGLADAFEVTRSIIGGVAGALTAGYYSATESSLHYAEAVAKVEFLTGETAARASALISAFRAFGFTTDEATLTVQRLTMRLGAIDQAFKANGKISSSQTQQLKEMGLTVKDLTGAHGDLNVLLPKIIDHMKAMTDPLERDRLAMQLFGRNFGALAPLIRAGGDAFAKAEGDAKKFGVELSERQVEAFETYSSAVETAKESVQGFVLEFGVMALPYFQKGEDLIKRVAAWWKALNPHIRESIVHMTGLVTVFGGLIGGGEALGAIVRQLQGLPVIGQLIASTLGPFSVLLSVIGPIIAAFLVLQHLYLTNKDAAALLKPIMIEMNNVWNEFRSTAIVVGNVLREIATDALAKGKGSFKDFVKLIATDVVGILQQLGLWLIQIRDWVYDNREAIKEWADRIETFASQLAKFIADVLKPFMDSTGGFKDFIFNQLIPALAGVVWPTVDPLVKEAWNWLKDHGHEVGQVLKDIAVGYAAIKIVGSITSVVTGIYEFAAAFRVVQAEEGTVIALQRVLGIEATVNAFKASAAWIASAAASSYAWVASKVETLAIYALMAADAITNAAKAAAAWVVAAAHSTAAAVKSGAAWVAANVAAGTSAIGNAAKMVAAWVAAAAMAVAQAARAAAAWLIANGTMLVVRAATLAWTAAQWLLNAALTANPIGLIIVAIGLLVVGVIWAYNNVGWFRDAVNAAWRTLQGWAAWVTGTLLPALGTFFSWLGGTAQRVVGGVGAAFSGLGTTVQNIWSSIAATIRNYVNQIISLIDNFIGGVNKITIPSWVPGVGGQHSNIPLIPHLASGAVIGRPTLAMVGEGRETEVVATLSQAVRAGMLAASSGGGGQPITVEFHVDGRLIERRTSKITGQRIRLQGGGLGSAA